MSKMGVSTIRSYKSAQIFEAVGLSDAFVEAYFPGTPVAHRRIGSKGAIANVKPARHTAAYSRTVETPGLDSGGAIHWRNFSEGHRLSPSPVASSRGPSVRNDPERLPPVRRRHQRRTRSLCTLRGSLPSRRATRCRWKRWSRVEPREAV